MQRKDRKRGENMERQLDWCVGEGWKEKDSY